MSRRAAVYQKTGHLLSSVCRCAAPIAATVRAPLMNLLALAVVAVSASDDANCCHSAHGCACSPDAYELETDVHQHDQLFFCCRAMCRSVPCFTKQHQEGCATHCAVNFLVAGPHLYKQTCISRQSWNGDI